MKYNITTMRVTKGRSRGMFLEIKGIKNRLEQATAG